MRWIIYIASLFAACLYGIIARGELSFGAELLLPVAVWVAMFMVKTEEDEDGNQ